MIASLPEAWTQLRPHPTQARAWGSPSRVVAIAAGRGSGKTELARRRVVSFLPVQKPWADPKYFYALPTYNQAKLVAWDALCALIPKHWLRKEPSVSSMIIETVFGSKLYVVGLDKPARIEGVQWDGGVIDESSDQKPGVFDRSVRPALTHREGWCWRIGVPKRFGSGAREFKLVYDQGMKGTGGVESYTWPSWDILPKEEIQILQQQLSSKDFLEQVGGNFVDAGGKAYYEFSESNIRSVAYRPDLPILVGSDFNVDPMAWVLGQMVDTEHGRGLQIFDELWIRNTNTRATLDILWNKYGSTHKGGFIFTGDATSRARKTAASSSDYKQIKNDERFNAKVRYDKSNPAVRDRLAAVNLLLCNAANQVKLFIDHRCVHLLDDLANRSLTEFGEPCPAEPGSAHDSGHATDALGYLVYKYFPVVADRPEGQRLAIVGGHRG